MRPTTSFSENPMLILLTDPDKTLHVISILILKLFVNNYFPRNPVPDLNSYYLEIKGQSFDPKTGLYISSKK